MNKADEDEIKAALTPDLIDRLVLALRGCRANLAPAWELPDEVIERDIIVAIAGFMALTGGGWPPSQRQEFQDQAAADLSDLPAVLLIPAIVSARRSIYVPARFVCTIRERLAEAVEKLGAELQLLERLAALAGVR